MKEEGTGPIKEFREPQTVEALRIKTLAREKGLKPFSKQFPNVWVLEEETGKETSKIPTRFFHQRCNDKGEVLFQEHNISFPIGNPTQLVESLEALNVLYKANKGFNAYYKDDPDPFIKFVGVIGGSIAGKQSQPKS